MKYEFNTPDELKENSVTEILQSLANTINSSTSKTEIFANIITVSGTDLSEVSYVLYLLPVYGNGYNYRYIEISQPTDNIVPIKIKAFQNPPTEYTIENKEDWENNLFKIISLIYEDTRTKIVFSQLKNIGKTLKDWEDERKK